jgi:hypothetical protein
MVAAPVQWLVCKDYPNTATHTIPVALAIEPTRGIEVSMSDRENGDVPLAMAVIRVLALKQRGNTSARCDIGNPNE